MYVTWQPAGGAPVMIAHVVKEVEQQTVTHLSCRSALISTYTVVGSGPDVP